VHVGLAVALGEEEFVPPLHTGVDILVLKKRRGWSLRAWPVRGWRAAKWRCRCDPI
jgi:hypothetical protein